MIIVMSPRVAAVFLALKLIWRAFVYAPFFLTGAFSFKLWTYLQLHPFVAVILSLVTVCLLFVLVAIIDRKAFDSKRNGKKVWVIYELLYIAIVSVIPMCFGAQLGLEFVGTSISLIEKVIAAGFCASLLGIASYVSVRKQFPYRNPVVAQG